MTEDDVHLQNLTGTVEYKYAIHDDGATCYPMRVMARATIAFQVDLSDYAGGTWCGGVRPFFGARHVKFTWMALCKHGKICMSLLVDNSCPADLDGDGSVATTDFARSLTDADRRHFQRGKLGDNDMVDGRHMCADADCL